jgi:hypothetical protein
VVLACIVGVVAALVLAAGLLGWKRRQERGLRWKTRAPARRTRLQLTLDAGGAARSATKDGGGHAIVELARWADRFGVLLLAPPGAEVGQLVFTRPDSTRTVLVELDSEPGRSPGAAGLPERLRRHGAGEATGGAVLPARETRRLLDAVQAQAPDAFERLFLSTSAGPLVVEDGAIHLPDVTLDLRRALVHDSYVFLEGPVLYRALAVRQVAATGGGELHERVFVVPLAEPLGDDHDRSRAARIPHRAAPRREHRVALEQLFFAPLAALVAEAPRRDPSLDTEVSAGASLAATDRISVVPTSSATASTPGRAAES